MTLVVSAFADGPRRYSDLSHRIAVIQKALRSPERDGLLRWSVTPAVDVSASA
ncbi:hypothetical protein JOF29_001586 [Kribbella aluminosa]|uniref:HxlR family transcriptional regulator n=1 Tax=Kribbella aluminosa TaxID=416017 RepID=A0ABS4UFT5_9ACTN|nr:hypothetical protein [Kribbella aluminosa]MBP2350503.1 hypothetical protein [Kribbella aluminosa]